jgi:hypothetical protein
MKKGILLILLSVAFLGSVFQPSGVAVAETEPQSDIRRRVHWGHMITEEGSGFAWVDPEGVYHIRNRKDLGFAKGDIHGQVSVVYNADIHLATNTGKAYGTIEIRTPGRDIDCRDYWRGEWEQKIFGGAVVDGTMRATGYGVYQGQELIVTRCYQEKGGMMINTGYIHYPPIDPGDSVR